MMQEGVLSDERMAELSKLQRSSWVYCGLRWFVHIALFAEILAERQPAPKCAAATALGFCLLGELRDRGLRKRECFLVAVRDLVIAGLGLNATRRALLALFAVQAVYDVDRSQHLLLLIPTAASFAFLLKGWLEFETVLHAFTRALRTASDSPPRFAEFLLYLILPRRNRESVLGDLNEDFTTEVLPKFGPLLAKCWYWYKAIRYVSMYACENAVEPLIRNVIEPLWRRVVLPLLKWTVAPAVLIHKLGWADALRAIIDRLR